MRPSAPTAAAATDTGYKVTYAYDYNGKPIEIYCSVSFGDFGLFVTFEK